MEVGRQEELVRRLNRDKRTSRTRSNSEFIE
jgi:hypothetical protein